MINMNFSLLTSMVSGSHLSNTTERTLLTCTPKLRCIPEHSIHTKIPKLVHAHSGSLARQSAHFSFPGILLILFNISFWFSSFSLFSFCVWSKVAASNVLYTKKSTYALGKFMSITFLRSGECCVYLGDLSEFNAAWVAALRLDTHSFISLSFSACKTKTLHEG